MATWTVQPSTENNSMKGRIDVGEHSSEWQVYQDEKPFLEEAKRDRDNHAAGLNKTDLGYKKFATIPDIVAIDIRDKYGIDIHDPSIMQDKERMARFMLIVKQNYQDLMSY